MDFIKTRPPVTQAEIEDLITRLESVKSKNFDGFILSNLVRTCHECALKKAELIKLSIMDVASGSKIRDFMEVGDSVVKLSGQAKEFLQAHIDYLKNMRYKVKPQSPFSPTIKDRRYTAKTLDNHLKEAQNAESKPDGPSTKASDTVETHITLEQIRQAGICNYYDKMRQKGFSASQCLEETKIFARHKSYRATKDLLAGKIQPTGVKINPVQEYMEEIEEIISPKKFKIRKKRTPPEIQQAIEKDPKLNIDEKQILKKELEITIKNAKLKSAQPKSPTSEPCFKSITEAIKSIDPNEF
jgi:hypothetical protein